jgi:hypothetical protein
MASLDASRKTLKRARKDLADLQDAVLKLQRGEQLDPILGNFNPQGIVRYNLPNPLQDLSVSVGVITGQLRAALDQLVYSLFELHQGHPPPSKRRTQFPICTTPEDFRSRIKPDLEGLNVGHITLIERSQPYHGRQWLKELKLLAEEHKHRKLVYIHSGSRVQMSFRAADTAETKFFVLPRSGVKTPKAVNVYTRIVGPIAFRDGTPVIDKLQILEAEVAGIVDAFKPFFYSS